MADEMTREEARVATADLWCGCGNPEEAAATLLRLLRLHPLYENREEFKAWMADTGVEMILLNLLDEHGLNEHGSSIGGAWLTDKGEALRDALAREEQDGFEVFINGPDEDSSFGYCVHGFDSSAVDHDCMAVDREERKQKPVSASLARELYEALKSATEQVEDEYVGTSKEPFFHESDERKALARYEREVGDA